MKANPVQPAESPFAAITDEEFNTFRKLIYDWAGVYLNESKKALVSGRLLKRLRHYGFSSFSDYLRIVTDNKHPQEKEILISLLTTHETYFFREKQHFDWLLEKAKSHQKKEIFRVWSAATSTGQEAYSIAMVLADALGMTGWEVLGSDISRDSLAVAVNATYPIEQASKIPENYLHRFCLKGIKSETGKFCIHPDLLANVRFSCINLAGTLPAGLGLFDAIFLRNTLIYFDDATRRKVIDNLLPHLKPNGNLIIGHAESLHSFNDKFNTVRPTIYAVKQR